MFEYLKTFWQWVDDNPEKVSPALIAVYMALLHRANQSGWKEKIVVIASDIQGLSGINSRTTMIKVMDELEKEGFVKTISRTQNQYQNRVICLPNFGSHVEATWKAREKHVEGSWTQSKTNKDYKDFKDFNTHTPKKSKPNNKHLWKDSKYYQNPELFCADWYLTPRSNEDKNIDPMVVYATINEAALSHEYKYANWIQAAANWTRKNPNRFYSGILQHVPKIVADFAARNADHTNGGIDPTTGRPWES